MTPCGAEHIVFQPFSAGHPLHITHLADWIRRVGIAVSVAGAFEAAPDGTARAWRWTAGWLQRVRIWLAKRLPWLRPRAAPPALITGTGGAAMGKGRISAHGTVWAPNAPGWEQIPLLYSMHMALDRRVIAIERQAQELAEGVRGELRQAVDELRAASAAITLRIEETENRTAQADARGIWVVAAGIVIAGVPGELAAWPLLGVALTGASVVVAVRVGVLVARSVRTRGSGKMPG